MPLSKLQKKIVTLYCDGDMSHVATMEEAKNCGDTLLLFLLREAHDAGDTEEFLGMLAKARDGLDNLLSALPKLRKR